MIQGGVTWAPEVINDAKDFGLILGENGLLYDTKKGDFAKKCQPNAIIN